VFRRRTLRAREKTLADSNFTLAFYLIDAPLMMTARSNIDIISMTLAEGDRVRGSTWPFRDHHEPSFAASWDALAIISLPARASEKTPVSKQRRRHAATTSVVQRGYIEESSGARSRRSEASSRTCPSEATLFSEQRLIFSRIYRQPTLQPTINPLLARRFSAETVPTNVARQRAAVTDTATTEHRVRC